MTDLEISEQAIKQCQAVAHMAGLLSDLYTEWSETLSKQGRPWMAKAIGESSARHMEHLREALGGDLDATWLRPVFARAHVIWPQED